MDIKHLIKEAVNNALANNNIADYDTVTLGKDPKVKNGAEWAKNGGNFPIIRNGQTWYVSRSVTVSMKAYCKNEKGEWCVLANKRGPNTRNSGAWNTPVGYLDYNETFEQAAIRETWEETGVNIPPEKVRMIATESHPHGRVQDVVIRFGAVLDGVIDDYPLSDANSEPGEVSDIQWIPLSKVKKYRWNAEAQLYHAKKVLGPLLDNGKTNDELITELYYYVKNIPEAVALLKQLANNIQ